MDQQMPSDGGVGLFNCLSQQRRLDTIIPVVAKSGEEPTPREIDSLVAKEMAKLSMQEREKAMHDVHGISEDEEEDLLVLASCLLELDIHVTAMKPGTAYELAEAMSRPYVTDQNFRSMFARADRYDSKKAAERMLGFFELKKGLFGAAKLVKAITLGDLNEDDIDSLRSGSLQLSPYKDTAGRIIIVNLMKLRSFKTIENLMRAQYYVFMASIETEEAQKRGVVAVYYLLDTPDFKSVSGKLRKDLPVHFASLHMCFNDIKNFSMASMGVYLLSTNSKVRFRRHHGSHIEVQYALTTFGIPRDSLPVSVSGDTNTDYHCSWLQERRRVESERASLKKDQASFFPKPIVVVSDNSYSYNLTLSSTVSSVVIQPSDILFGRGKTVVEHPGNTRFRSIVDSQMKQYESASRLEKTCMADTIVGIVKDTSGRFLKRDEFGGWEEVDDAAAREKVAHAFRNRRKFHGV